MHEKSKCLLYFEDPENLRKLLSFIFYLTNLMGREASLNCIIIKKNYGPNKQNYLAKF